MERITLEDIAESYINGNISWCKKKIKSMNKYLFLQLVYMLQDLGVNDEEIERLVN